MCAALFACAASASEPEAKLLGPGDSVQPVPGTGVLLLVFGLPPFPQTVG